MKTEYICERWLKGVRQHYFEAFVNCLLPCPPEYAQVGGNWYDCYNICIINKLNKFCINIYIHCI